MKDISGDTHHNAAPGAKQIAGQKSAETIQPKGQMIDIRKNSSQKIRNHTKRNNHHYLIWLIFILTFHHQPLF
jgi:hypothetical protein